MLNGLSQKYLDELTYEVVGSAIEIHKIMGRGLLESVYHRCMAEELMHRKINFLTESKEGQKTFINEYFKQLPKK